ncbi:SAM-dependent chlorinase/fluorinase [Mesonia sp. MT50]|uniref:SAM-dependent chlorinase/fluorinase n=1 Tax=Mesonia profundi TaxID=3070998 RepID=A0ABU0ZXE7_9FLAO|nr:SAM-dependent chlorinase/fluorinase [Mesonia profundi]MDQ7916142.1 SAM-dependent chlorinase/fluorinase [Mesonia profundi]
MAIITLTTDFGLKDPSTGAVKGAILSELEGVNIVDISHNVSPFHITEAAYIIKNAYSSFPKGTIHIIGVDSEITPENKHIAIQLDDHFFICANNGIMSLIAAEIKPQKLVEVNIHNAIETNFPVLDVFVKVACHIARGGTLEVIGKSIPEVKQITKLNPFINDNQDQIIGHVMYIDTYGNVVTNISRKIFENIGKGRSFTINARSTSFTTIHESYSHAIDFNSPKDNREEEGKKLAIFNASNYVEIAIYKSNPHTVGSASTLLGLQLMDTINIKFNS